MNWYDVKFRRRFSVNLYRNLRLDMGKMSFFKNWVTDRRGDPYPVLQRSGDVQETVGQGAYETTSEQGGFVRRLLGSFFPWNTYEACIKDFSSTAVGFCLSGDAGELSVWLDAHGATVSCNEKQVKIDAQVQKTLFLQLPSVQEVSACIWTGGSCAMCLWIC
ncbi:MAG: hypothetical protein IJW30_02470 [Clostridia bacterium]|nr:hypothetical protein [Clostridia bacterium]